MPSTLQVRKPLKGKQPSASTPSPMACAPAPPSSNAKTPRTTPNSGTNWKPTGSRKPAPNAATWKPWSPPSGCSGGSPRASSRSICPSHSAKNASKCWGTLRNNARNWSAPSGQKQFDAVTLWAVVEHLLEPKQFLAKAWSVLKPDGLCFVLVQNMKSLAARALGARYRYLYPQHLNYF